MSERGPLALRLAPGLAKALLRLCLPPETLRELGPALDAIDWSFEAVAALLRERLGVGAEVPLSAREIEDFLDALEREASPLSREARARVVNALGEALAEAGSLSPSLLVAADLATSRVASSILEARAARELEGVERIACERLCQEAARALVASASRRAGFAEAVAGETLARLRRIEDSLQSPDEFDGAYRGAIGRRHDHLRLYGLPRGAVSVDEAVPVRISGPIESRRTLLLGEAGAGKTTMAQRLVVAAARSRDRVPFLVPLRGLREGAFPSAREILAASVPHLGDEAPRGWVQRAFRRGALLVFDGLDELARPRRREFFEWVEELARDVGGDLRVIVTGRPGAVRRPQGDLLAGARPYAAVNLEPLEPHASTGLIRTWWRAARGGAGLEELLAAVEADAGLGSLVSNPLLATLVAAAHHAGGDIPRHRAAASVAAARALLGRDDTAALGADIEDRLSLVQRVAWWFAINGHRVVDAAELDEALGGLGLGPPAELRHALVEKSGLFRQSPEGICFSQSLVRDGLAARQALATASYGMLAEHAHDEGWKERVAAALELAQGEARARLVSRLRLVAERRPERRGRVEALLAGAGLAGAPLG